MVIFLKTWVTLGHAISPETASAARDRLQECLGAARVSNAVMDRFAKPDASDPSRLRPNVSEEALTAFEDFSVTEIEGLDCRILDHMLWSGSPCRAARGPGYSYVGPRSLQNLADQMGRESSFFGRMLSTFEHQPSLRYAGLGLDPDGITFGIYDASTHAIEINDVFICLPEGLELPTLAHEYIHAYTREVLGVAESSSEGEILAEMLAYHFLIDSDQDERFSSAEEGESRLLDFVKNSASSKINAAQRQQWSRFNEWWISGYTDIRSESGDTVYDMGGELIFAELGPRPEDSCAQANWYLRHALERAADSAAGLREHGPIWSFTRSIRARQRCLSRPSSP
ncbi:MAG: hypothetical protein HYT79_11090 [Elusimicrobia bacterium]|nr:hypothetical protein [Elusimicrobiota bacterium]